MVLAQEETIVSGKIFEKGRSENEPLPFVSIGFKGTTTGTTSDFEGRFFIKTKSPSDTLVISYIGYKIRYIKIHRGQKQQLIIELEQQINDLEEVVVKPGINPAIRIIKKAQEMRDRNDQNRLTAFEYDSYNKIDVSMNNISGKMKSNTVFKPLKNLLDTVNQMKNDEGKYILPIFISETFSHYYQNTNPSKSKEIVKGSNVSGIGVEQGSYVIDLLGAGMLQFNFNQNRLRILGKDFISPIASGSMGYYIYTLLDSMDIEGTKCFKIKLNLRREEDLGFIGMMWIADSSFAIKRIDVELAPSANVNFVKRMKIQQEMILIEGAAWLPEKVRMTFDLAEMSKNTNGFIANMYRSNSRFIINNQKGIDFFNISVERDEHVSERDSAFWNQKRSEPFTKVETQMFSKIDSVKKLPVVKTYLDILRLVLDGHYRIGKLDWGPYVFLVGYNNVEDVRFRLGFKTNDGFSNKCQLRTYIAYGTGDQKVKYGISGDYILSKKRWTTIGAAYKDDYDILGVTDNTGGFTQKDATSNIFTAFSFAVPRARINRTIDYRIKIETQPFRDWTFQAILQNTWFHPEGNFYFAYKTDPNGSEIKDDFTYTAATFELRYAYKEVMVLRGVERTRIVRAKAPIVTFTYTRGLKDILGGQFDYDKVQLNFSQHISTGIFGNADYSFTIGKIFGQLPYPLLDVPRGNQTFFYSDNNYSLMNMYDFIANEYSHFRYVQHFEGLFFNRIPLLRKWRLRNFALVKATYGAMSNQDQNLLPRVNKLGYPISPVMMFEKVPYVEVGYGIENIFRFFTLGVFNRLTYLEKGNSLRQPRNWGINVGIRFAF